MPRLELLGGFALLNSQGASVSLPRKARALVAYLALSGGRPVPREKLAALLWEDSSETQARASLRQALTAIRREAAEDVIDSSIETCSLAPGVEVDVLQFEALDGAEARAARYSGDLLDGFLLPETGFSAWLAAERARIRDRAIGDFAEYAEAALAARRHEAAVAVAQRLVALDPLHEPGHRLLMRAYAETGRTAEALRQYRGLQAMLRRELSAAPEPATMALAQELARRRSSGAVEPVEFELPEEAPATAQPVAAAPTDAEPRRELRRMAVLSIGIAGFASLSSVLDVEGLEELLATAHQIVEAESSRSGGHLLDRQSDVVTLLFGPGQAHDDDPLRAARVAQAIHDRLAAEANPSAMPVSARIGLAAGPLLLLAQDGRTSAIGEALAVAAQLRALADPGATLVPGPLLAELGSRFLSEPAGRHGGGAVHRLGAAAPDPSPPPLAGRAAEIAQMEAMLEVAAEEAGRTLLVRGEAGIGKSRLAEAAATLGQDRGWRVLRAGIADFGDLAASTPRRQLVLSLLGLEACDPLPDRLEDHPLVQGLAADALPLLYQIAGGVAPPELARRTGTPATEVATARDGVFRSLLSAAARTSPLLLLVEDAHWASPEVIGQLQALSRMLAGVPALLLVTTRPEPDHFDQNWRAGAGPLSTIDLGPLGREAARTVAQSLGVANAAEARDLVARAGGNPLFLRQLAAALSEGVALSDALPGSVQGLTLGRMDRLDPEERLALRAAAVIGPRTELEAVRAVANLPNYIPTQAALGPLLSFDGHSLAFVHALIRDAVNSVTTSSERRSLHRGAAAWYRGRNPELHARHLERAGDEGAAAAWAAAAQDALARHRHDKALAHVTAGLKVATGPADHFRLGLVQSLARMRQLDFRGAAESAREAGTHAPTTADKVRALTAEADAESARQAYDRALELLDQAAAIAEPAGLAEAMARILGLKGNIHFPRGHLEQCLADHGTALVWSRRAGSPTAEAGALAGLAWAHYQRGAFGEGMRQADACLAIAEGDRFERIRLSALRARSVCRLFLLDHDGSLADAMAAVALAVDQGDTLNEMLSRTTAATVHLERWIPGDAIAVAEPAMSLMPRIGSIGLEAAPLWALGTAHGELGDTGRARQLLELARAAGMRGTAIRFAVPRILGTLATFSQSAERAELVKEGERLLEAMPTAHSANGLYGSALLGALTFGEHALADRCIRGLGNYLVGDPEPWAAAMLEFGQSFLTLSKGDSSVIPAAARFHGRARHEPGLNWLRPAMRAVEKRALSRQGASAPAT